MILIRQKQQARINLIEQLKQAQLKFNDCSELIASRAHLKLDSFRSDCQDQGLQIDEIVNESLIQPQQEESVDFRLSTTIPNQKEKGPTAIATSSTGPLQVQKENLASVLISTKKDLPFEKNRQGEGSNEGQELTLRPQFQQTRKLYSSEQRAQEKPPQTQTVGSPLEETAGAQKKEQEAELAKCAVAENVSQQLKSQSNNLTNSNFLQTIQKRVESLQKSPSSLLNSSESDLFNLIREGALDRLQTHSPSQAIIPLPNIYHIEFSQLKDHQKLQQDAVAFFNRFFFEGSEFLQWDLSRELCQSVKIIHRMGIKKLVKRLDLLNMVLISLKINVKRGRTLSCKLSKLLKKLKDFQTQILIDSWYHLKLRTGMVNSNRLESLSNLRLLNRTFSQWKLAIIDAKLERQADSIWLAHLFDAWKKIPKQSSLCQPHQGDVKAYNHYYKALMKKVFSSLLKISLKRQQIRVHRNLLNLKLLSRSFQGWRVCASRRAEQTVEVQVLLTTTKLKTNTSN